MFDTLSTEKETLKFHFLEIISLSVSSEVLSTKSLQEIQICFIFKLSYGAFFCCVSGGFSVCKR